MKSEHRLATRLYQNASREHFNDHVERQGRLRGELMGVAPNGRRRSWAGTVIDLVVDGRIVESWGNGDTIGVLQQLGAIPVGPARA